MGQAQYGEVAMFQTFLTALVALTGLSLQGAAGRKYYDVTTDDRELALYIGACLQILCAMTAVVALIMFLSRDALSLWLGIRTQWFAWSILAAASTFVVQLRMSQWLVRRKSSRYGAMQVAQSLANMGLSLILVVYFRRGADGRILAMVAVPIVMGVLALVLLQRDRLLTVAWRPALIREASSYGLPLLPHVLGLMALSTVDRVVVNRELGLAQAGVYMVAVQLAMGLALVFDAVNSSYVPWLFERLARDLTREKREIVRWTYYYFSLALLAAGFAFLIGPSAVRLLVGERYAAAGTAIGWLALGQAFSGMYLTVTNYIFFSKRTGMLSLVTIVSSAMLLLILPPLTHRFGLSGASIAFAAGMLARFLLTWWVAQIRHPMPWFDFRADTLT